MAIDSGRYPIGPTTGRVVVKTTRTGLGRKAGHDLTIEVTRWAGELVADTADFRRSSVTVSLEVGSLEIREGIGGLKPLTDSDREEIKDTIRDQILHPDAHPTITFTSTDVAGTERAPAITGDLTIMGDTHPVTIQAAIDEEKGQIHGETTIVQSQWGIKPYSAFMGALRLADEVRLELDLTLPSPTS